MPEPSRWSILTGEYPPQIGGVADYTRLVATGLAAAGDGVTVYAPPADSPDPSDPGVTVRRLPDRFGRRGLSALEDMLGPPGRAGRVLVQYVPYGYGWRGMNLPFCHWVYDRARKGDRVELVFHEVFLMFGRNPKYWPVAAAHRAMAALLLRAATRVWYVIPMWERLLRPYAPRGTAFRWLPVPSTVPVGPGRGDGSATHAIGHFGSFPAHVSGQLAAALKLLIAKIPGTVLLIGVRSQEFRDRLVADHPAIAGRVTATGPVDLSAVPALLGDCEVMLHPVGGGITGRNTSILACLRNGRPVVTTTGWLTEPFWAESGAVVLAPTHDPAALAGQAEALLADPIWRRAMAARGRELYDRMFDLRHAVAALREDVETPERLRS